jgi:hypothetical protein
VTVQRDAATIRRERVWKAVSATIGVVGGMIANRILRLVYRRVSKEDPDAVFDPTSKRFSWANSVVWAMAAGIGLVIAKMISDRIAVIGWKAATGTLPPTDTAQPG